MDTAAVLRHAGTQRGMISRRQLVELGTTASALSRSRRRGVLVPVLPNVFRVASSPPDFRALCTAVELQTEGSAFLSGPTAGRLHGLRRMPETPLHVTVAEGRRLTGPPWLVVHFSSWFDARQDSTRIDGLTVATPLRTLFGLAARFNQYRFERAAEDAWHLGLVTPQDAADYLERHRCRGKDGVRTMERWLEKALGNSRPAQSQLEIDLLHALVKAGLPEPVRQFPLTLQGGEMIHLDLAWPDIRLAVEPGAAWWHGGDLGQRRDHARDRGCSELGWMIVRFDEKVRADIAAAARQVVAIHARRRLDFASSAPAAGTPTRSPSEMRSA